MLYPKDPKVRVERHEKTLRIEWNWGTGSGYVFLVMGVTILFIMVWAAFVAPGNRPDQTFGQSLTIAIVGNMVTSVPIIIYGLTMTLNRTIIHADHERFLIRVVPLGWVKSKVVGGKKIKQFFVGFPQNPQSSASNALFLLDDNQLYMQLSTIFPSGFAAHQICHELQDWYGLEDMPVFGQNTLPHQPGSRDK
jgi:hypothetical protein